MLLRPSMKSPEEMVHVNAGFFVLEPSVIDLIYGDECTWEEEPLKNLAQARELMTFKHRGFWRPMDTLRDKNDLEALWRSERPPWKMWD